MAEKLRQLHHASVASRAPTVPELTLYALLDDVVGEGKWNRQQRVFGKWMVDAALPNLQLVIQADGEYWHGRLPKSHSDSRVVESLRNDRAQAAYLEKAGWLLLRLWEHDLKRRPEWCADQIREYVALATARSRSLPSRPR